MSSCWIGVACREHVASGVRQGICQLGHGKEAPVRRLKRGDLIVYYSPRERLGDGAPVQAFTAAGRILDETPYQVYTGNGFHMYRRNTEFFPTRETPIHPILQKLSFTRGRENWGMCFRHGVFKITSEDYQLIAHAMGIEVC
ncbi:hypothetical protein AAKU58_004236 [Oxalobacteraceae bacterium GrIS 1.18]